MEQPRASAIRLILRMRRRRRTTCVSPAVCFFLPWRVTNLTVLRLTASSASLIEADKSPRYLRFSRSSLSRPTNSRTLKTSKLGFLRIATGRRSFAGNRYCPAHAVAAYDLYLTLECASTKRQSPRMRDGCSPVLEDPCANDHILPDGFPGHPDAYGNNLHRPSQTLHVHRNEVWSLTASVIESRGRLKTQRLATNSPRPTGNFLNQNPSVSPQFFPDKRDNCFRNLSDPGSATRIAPLQTP